MESWEKMYISNALSGSPVSDPPEDSGVEDVEAGIEKTIINAIYFPERLPNN